MKKLYELSAKDAAIEFGEALPAEEETGLFTTDEQSISGLGVEDVEFNDEEEENTISELLNALNNADNVDMAEAIERERKDREEYLRKEEESYKKRLASAQDDYNRKRYEAEQAAKKERLAREEEERRIEEEEERKAKESSLVGRLGKLFKKKEDRSEDIESEEITSAIQDIPAEIVKEEVINVTDDTKTEREEVEEESFDYDLFNEVAEDSDDTPITIETPQSEAIDVPETVKDVKKEPVKPLKTVKEKPIKDKKEDKKNIFSLLKKNKTDIRQVVENTPVIDTDEPDWKYIALHDEPTGMLNSRAYHDAIKKVPNTVAVVFFDINNLKYVNDNFSHQDGDMLIKNCSASILKHFGEDNVYRIGGDEFVAILPKAKNLADHITDCSAKIHKDLQECFKQSKNHIPHAVSIGYAIGDGEHTVDEIIKAADASMYRNKKAYKQAHPDYNVRKEEPESKKQTDKVEKDHDELLSKDQRGLKERIKNKHQMPTAMSTKNLIREIQKKSGEVHAILIASPTFDHLFIIRNVDDFINLVLEQEAFIDYSYLYVVWDGGSQYYGADEYYNEVTDIFKEIAEGLVSGKFKSEKDVRSVKGINIFRAVYL